MPLLVILQSTHYAAKDSNDAIQEILIANSPEQALVWIDKECLYDYFKDGEDKSEEDGGSGYFSPSDDWWEQNPTKRAEAEQHDLTVDEYGSVQGVGENLTRWLQSNSWKDADDAYYGETHYDWSKQKTISEEDAFTLLRLELAKDIRGWTPDDDSDEA
jgi:hypothetical protein